ncbi:energy transducer TonB [Sphingopyxis sp.]|uniref:energy transducer TonB n=1 Tax=Sphingopyxis sp. TaxID=1908224 RepID=UPI003BAB0DBF
MGEKIYLLPKAAISLLVALSMPVSAHAQERLVLAASSSWNINYADDYCRLQRMFGTGDEKVMLMIDRFSPSESFRLNLAGKRFSRSGSVEAATVQFGADLPEQKLEFYAGDLGKEVPAWLFIPNVRIRPLAEPIKEDEPRKVTFSEADEAAVNEIRIGKPLKQQVVLQTGSMKGAFGALRACTDELLRHWGIDVDRHREVAQIARPIGSPGNWLRNSDYPGDMVVKGEPGMVQFRLVIGEDGLVRSCHVQQSTNSEGFDEAVCNALKRRARFEPARDKAGNPLVSYYMNRVHFSVGR